MLKTISISADLAKQMLSAYRGSGGHAELHIVPPHGVDGHDLILDPAGMQIWSPIVDQFLRERGLPVGIADQAMIDALNGVHKAHLLAYLTAASEKAFALSEDGSWDWWVGGRAGTQDAVRDALEKCEDGGKRRCQPYAVNFARFTNP
jgi:hypothetical protein